MTTPNNYTAELKNLTDHYNAEREDVKKKVTDFGLSDSKVFECLNTLRQEYELKLKEVYKKYHN